MAVPTIGWPAIRISGNRTYLSRMRKTAFEPCLPTPGKQVPAGPAWLHEIKHDGYRLMVQREGKRVRLFTRNGHDWTDRYPLIVEAALKNRSRAFVIDGEAVLLGVDGISDFKGLHSRRHNDEVQLYAFDILALDGDDLRKLPCTFERTAWRGRWHGGRRGFSLASSNRAKSARTCSGRPAISGWRVLCLSAGTVPTAQAARRLDQGQESHPALDKVKESFSS